MSAGHGGSAKTSKASRPGLRGSRSPSPADRCRRRSGKSVFSRPSRGMNQRASKLPEQPSTKGASAVLWLSSAQTVRKRSKASALASRNRTPASVSLRPRPSLMKSATPRCSSNALSCRLTAPWVTCSCSAAWLTLLRRAVASKARRAFSGGRSWLILCVSFPDRLWRSYRFSVQHVRGRVGLIVILRIQPERLMTQTHLRNGPDANGLFGAFGGRYVAETLMPLILDLAREYELAKEDPAFKEELAYFQRDYVGRPSPLYYAERLTEFCGGAKIYLKREELNHTGAHKINNCIGQILLARRMGKKRIIAETGAGMHGVATATVAARFGLDCVIYMGTTDIERQQANVFRMKLLGAEVIPVVAGTGTLKDAMNEALRDWVTNVDSTFYLIGTVAGPHPYPAMVRDFQAVIGKETRTQLQAQEGRLPDSLVACIGGGSNAMGLFHPFLDDTSVEIIGVEAAGYGIETGKHAASLNGGVPGVLHGNRTFLLQDDDGQIIDAHSISAGLDYPGIGPEHAWLHDIGRVQYTSVTDDEALDAFHKCCRLEGIIPALESAHALAEVFKRAPNLPKDHLMVLNLSGRGDKDMQTVMHHMEQSKQEKH